MAKIRILVANEPEPIGGVTCWRMYWPLDDLDRNYGDTLDIRYSRGQIFPADLYWADIVMCFRPSEPSHIGVIKEARRLGKKILLDYDDDLTSLVVGHPEYWRLGTKTEIVNDAIALADAVWVSTQRLKDICKNPNCTVIPNAVYPELIPEKPADFKNKTAVWAGSPAHREDADEFKEDYRAIIRQVSRFIWMNYMPTWATKIKGQAAVDLSPWIHTEQYFEWLIAQNTVAIWKPLVSNDFNLAKSCISYLTATLVGGVCITNQAGTPQWEYAVKHFPKTESEFSQAWHRASDDVRTRYDAHRWNEVRLRELLKLANG